MSNPIPHWEFLDDAIVQATSFDCSPINVDFTGPLAVAIRKEAVETGKADIQVVYHYLLEYLADSSLPRQVPMNCLPLQVRIDGNLADLLRRNAVARGISPEDSAIEILADVFGIPTPKSKRRGKRRPTPKGLAFTIQVPGIVAQAIRRSNYPNPISSSHITGILAKYFADPDGQPVIPGMELHR